MKIKNIPLSEVKPYWRNPRKNEKAIAAVKKSIVDYGFNQPIIVDVKNVIIAGHTRYKALAELGWKEVPCVVLDIPANAAKAYRVADNKTSELSEWDMDALIPELREIEGIADMQIYFQDLNLEKLLQDTATVSDVTASQIDDRTERIEELFENLSEADQGKYVDVTCPKCGEEFFVNKNDIIRIPGKDETAAQEK